MSVSTMSSSSAQEPGASSIPQYRLPMILFMFAWPAAWFMFLIWVVRPLLFGTPAPGEFLPTWIFFGIATLGNAAELIVALVVLRREGYKLTLRDLRDRARLRWPPMTNPTVEITSPGELFPDITLANSQFIQSLTLTSLATYDPRALTGRNSQ